MKTWLTTGMLFGTTLLALPLVALAQEIATETGNAQEKVALENTSWRATRVNDKDVAATENQRAPYIVLQSSDHRVVGSGGCNRINGTYSVEKQSIHFGPIASTMMACPSGMDTEKEFLQALDQAHAWKIQGNELELYGEDGDSLVRFEAGKSK